MKIRLICMLVVLLCCFVSRAQTVGYSYKPLAAEGCSMKYSVSQGRIPFYYIIATVKSDRLTFLKESTMLIKNSDGEVIKLQGSLISNGSESAGVLIGNIVCPVTEISSTAQFKIMPEQFEKIKDGIAKVRLSTIPIEHERTFSKDKI